MNVKVKNYLSVIKTPITLEDIHQVVGKIDEDVAEIREMMESVLATLKELKN